MPIFSLPGEYGIGVLGKEAREFADFLASSGLHIWQVLPMVPAGAGNSPYSGISAFAGSPLYIDLEALHEMGLLTKEELKGAIYDGPSSKVDYDFLNETKALFLQKAFARLTPDWKEKISSFYREQKRWLDDYALYMTCMAEGHIAPTKTELTRKEEETFRNGERFAYYCFEQYLFHRQWAELKDYCNKLGIGLIGDLPFYVSEESSDVWAHPELFQLDRNFKPSAIAGTPPDYFSEEGQCWGNPLYDWDRMKQEGYRWWLDRISFHLKHYDALRIDHFRGFDHYWHIPAESADARMGHWEKGPGMELFHAYHAEHGAAPIIAEDLGTLDESFYAFLRECGYPGMKVLQFAFDGYSDSSHLPHNYSGNSIAYTGTHDNNTSLGWIWEAEDHVREQAIRYCGIPKDRWGTGGNDAPACKAFLRTLFQSVSSMALVPMQDLCGFGGDTRVNVPGEALGNWCFRFTKENIKEVDQQYILELSNTYKRNNPYLFIE